jgi:hypothetical protein
MNREGRDVHTVGKVKRYIEQPRRQLREDVTSAGESRATF